MRIIYNLMRSNTGSAGIMAIIAMVLLGTVGAAHIALSSTEGRLASNFRDGTAAQYLAEDGALWARIQLDINRGNNSTLISDTDSAAGHSYTSATKNINTPTAGSYTVIIKRDATDSANASKRQIISTGTANGASRQVVMTVTLASTGSSGLYSYAGYGGNSLIIGNSSSIIINGNVGTNSNATQWGGAVKGNLDYYGSFTGNYAGTGKKNPITTRLSIAAIIPIIPTIPSSTDVLVAPTPPSLNNLAYYKNQSGSKSLNSSISNGSGGPYTNMSGTYYATSYLDTGNTTFTIPAGSSAVIYADGNIQLKSGTVINGDVTLIANGYVQLDGATLASTNGTINIYAKSNIYIKNSSSVSASNITMWGGSNVAISETSTINGSGGLVSICANTGSFQDSYNGTDAYSAISAGNIMIWAGTAVDLSNHCRFVATGGSVIICANSSYFHDSYDGSTTNAAISGNNIAIWANTAVDLSNNCRFVANNGSAKIYANSGYFHLNGSSAVNAQDITIMTGDMAGLYGGSLTATNTTKLYAKTNFDLSSGSQISGNALVRAGGKIALNSGTSPNTVYIAGGDAQVASSVTASGPIYAVGNLEFDGGTINYNLAVMQSLGLTAGASPFAVKTIKNQNN